MALAAVCSAKSKEYFEICFVPLIPMSSKHIWLCSICQWQIPIQAGGCVFFLFSALLPFISIFVTLFSWEPQLVTNVPTQPGGYYPTQPGPHPGHQPSYPPQNYQPGLGYQGQYQQNPAQYQQNQAQYQGPPPVQYSK